MMKRFMIAVAILGLASAARADPLADEARRRGDALVKDGFSFTYGFGISDRPLHVELMIPALDDGEANTIAVWAAAAHGHAQVKLTGPGGEIIVDQAVATVDQRITRALPTGTYVLDVVGDGAHVYGELGVKGPALPGFRDPMCAIDAGRLTEHAADPAHGFAWPYLLVTGAPAATGKPLAADRLLVLPINTGFVTESLDALRASARCEAKSWLALADRLGTAILVPMFPRPAAPPPAENLYLHALSRAALGAARRDVVRVDRQLIAMIDHARGVLAATGTPIDPRVLIAGHSAAGMFTSRFTVLHPDRELAAAVSSPGGWPLAPVATAHGDRLTYPVGIADLAKVAGAPLDLAALRKVKLLFVLGADDTNDSVPARDSYDARDEAVIMRDFGKTPVARWDAARALYATAKLDATFKRYPAVGHETSPQMRADIEAMFRAALARPPATSPAP
jgi:dienelactone hydrolase